MSKTYSVTHHNNHVLGPQVLVTFSSHSHIEFLTIRRNCYDWDRNHDQSYQAVNTDWPGSIHFAHMMT